MLTECLRLQATKTQVSGYLWRKEGMASDGWKLYWTVLDCGNSKRAMPVLRFTSAAAHEAAILSGTGSEPTAMTASATVRTRTQATLGTGYSSLLPSM